MGDPITAEPGSKDAACPVPQLDLLLCTHNRAATLAPCLAHLERQTADPRAWGVVLVLNACTDDSDAVAEAARARGRLPNLRIVREPVAGLTHARRSAFAATGATWVLMLDDDVLLDPDWLAQALAFLREHPDTGVLGGRQDVEWVGTPHPLALARPEAFAAQDLGPEPREVTIDDPRGLVGSALLFRRELLLNSAWARHPLMPGHQGRAVTSGDDTEMFVRVLQSGARAWYLPSLRLRHLIPAVRTEPEHLGRLYRGYAATRVIMEALRAPRPPTRLQLASLLARHAWGLLRHGLAMSARRMSGHAVPGGEVLRAQVRRGRIDGVLTVWRNRARL